MRYLPLYVHWLPNAYIYDTFKKEMPPKSFIPGYLYSSNKNEVTNHQLSSSSFPSPFRAECVVQLSTTRKIQTIDITYLSPNHISPKSKPQAQSPTPTSPPTFRLLRIQQLRSASGVYKIFHHQPDIYICKIDVCMHEIRKKKRIQGGFIS